jgi:hypothetical protein
MSKSWSEVIENIDLSTKPLREPRKLSCDEITDLKAKFKVVWAKDRYVLQEIITSTK